MEKDAVRGFLRRHREAIERELGRALPQAATPPAAVHRAMRYSLFAGGKRLRPILVLAACQAVGGRARTALAAAAAVEMLHTYSLIHDDLPCMDDDDLRRGRPTCHKVFGEGMATLAGDGLLTQAFLYLARSVAGRPRLAAELVRELGEAAGSLGMVGGQAADLFAEGKRVSRGDVRFIHARKTGALIRGCLRMGARIGGASPRQLAAITRYGEAVGLAFQIVDDILDVTGDTKRLGKTAGKDAKKRKVTYPALYGLDRARVESSRAVARAQGAAAALGRRGRILSALADWVGSRDR